MITATVITDVCWSDMETITDLSDQGSKRKMPFGCFEAEVYSKP